MNSLATQIQARRKALDISQKETARRAGLEQPLVSGFEHGKDVRLSTLTKLAAALDLELLVVPRERLAEVESLLRHGSSPLPPVPDKSLLERFHVPDDEGAGS